MCSFMLTHAVQNFYLTGKDVGSVGLAGELQGGWAAANAVLGYSVTELTQHQRNVVADLRNVKT